MHEGEDDLQACFTYSFGQRVKIRPPHPEAGATGPVTNAYLFRDGREEVFVSVPGGVGVYKPEELEPVTQVPMPTVDKVRARTHEFRN